MRRGGVGRRSSRVVEGEAEHDVGLGGRPGVLPLVVTGESVGGDATDVLRDEEVGVGSTGTDKVGDDSGAYVLEEVGPGPGQAAVGRNACVEPGPRQFVGLRGLRGT